MLSSDIFGNVLYDYTLNIFFNSQTTSSKFRRPFKCIYIYVYIGLFNKSDMIKNKNTLVVSGRCFTIEYQSKFSAIEFVIQYQYSPSVLVLQLNSINEACILLVPWYIEYHYMLIMIVNVVFSFFFFTFFLVSVIQYNQKNRCLAQVS